ncbi:hypothetical protein FRZ67_21575 [Panacibacter ginsenosidivorans]|uniref:DUF922 domain-containing protein n=1 Tax=Panacibacter ginsenosidivorans TaxID=1813871 RepID=A0A5B8VFE6_9BACT|nr:hypothetical protein [Panacibacter ginsenosidivorans]QEC69761.1 hypothetical protein FRZ67_21575 [Panacibacter ginsenosidivorans]
MKYFILAVTFFILFSCAPKLSSKITTIQPSLPVNTPFIILEEDDTSSIRGNVLGTLRSSDNGFSVNCSYEKTVELLKSLALTKGANVLKITEHKYPDVWSSCHRIKADIYKVHNVFDYEKEIEWSKNRKLTWDDFKGTPKVLTNINTAAQTYCGFAYRSSTSSMISSARSFTKATFDCRLSWVKPEEKGRADLLEHEQGHFDLSEIYRRLLSKRLSQEKINSFNSSAATDRIYKDVSSSYLTRQEAYERETNYGLDRQKQLEWEKEISVELLNSDNYSVK